MKKLLVLVTVLSLSALCNLSVAGAVTFPQGGSVEHRTKAVSPPAAAIDEEGKVYLAWIEEEKDSNSIYIVTSSDSGKSFSPAVRINGTADTPGAIHASPSLTLGKNGEVYAAWTIERPEGVFASDIRFARSTDGAKTFSPSIKVNDNARAASAGFESMAVGPDGAIYIAWLDGREKEKDKGSVATYLTVSHDSGKTFGKNIRIDGNSCPCCRTAVTVGKDGAVYVAWRKVFDNNIREIVLTRSDASGKNFSSPAIVGGDRWEIAGCPHRGPSIGVTGEGKIMVFLYSEGEGEPRVYLAESEDGEGFRKETIEHKKSSFPDNPALTVLGNNVYMAWQETTPVFSNIVFESRVNGEVKRVQLNQDARRASNPVISTNRRGDVLVAWLKQEIRTARAVVLVGR